MDNLVVHVYLTTCSLIFVLVLKLPNVSLDLSFISIIGLIIFLVFRNAFCLLLFFFEGDYFIFQYLDFKRLLYFVCSHHQSFNRNVFVLMFKQMNFILEIEYRPFEKYKLQRLGALFKPKREIGK